MSQILSCADSPLSITGNIIGILTFAYAVLITLVYRTKQLASANEEMGLFLQRASSELDAFLAARERLMKHLPVFPTKLGSYIEPFLAGTQDTVDQFEDQFKSLKELGGRKPSIFEGSRFVWTKKDFLETLGEMSRIRSNLDGIYQVLVNSAIFDEIQNQKAALEEYHKTVCMQKNMLRQIMDALHLEAPKNTKRV
ncbi:uncharacterized protein ATNIH1004_004715 [Aspergillus tanneri]|uniref:Uncharacterized protein n=1 Tax=Aspergillus tanneri TaxID=1220188 RepID=A0A5M9MU33_9EURO|nr:uncharacterized protein ATNIH1004_004715 [Aspergillus tanneri]KAA8648830.1 hypothetical protein ATNIH1004_004715 [Aspergillus tanneri]